MNFWEIFLPCLAALWLICSIIVTPTAYVVSSSDKHIAGWFFKLLGILFIVLLGPIAIGIILSKTKD